MEIEQKADPMEVDYRICKGNSTTLEEAKKQRCQKLFSKPEAQRIEEKVFRRNRKEGLLGRGRTFNTLLSSKC